MKPNSYYDGTPAPSKTFRRVATAPKNCLVYLIELDPAVGSDPAFAKKNERMVPGSPSYYVGMTSLRPEDRFLEHVTGGKNASRIALRFGRALRMDLVGDQKPLRRSAALSREKLLARNLRKQGFGAWQA